MNQHDALQIENRGEVISRYKHLRKVSVKLNDKIVQTLSKEVLHEGGKKLGILQSGTLVFNTEDETSVLMDYCLYDVRRKRLLGRASHRSRRRQSLPSRCHRPPNQALRRRKLIPHTK